MNLETLKRLLAAKIENVDFGHTRKDMRLLLAKKEEGEYFSKVYFLALLGHYFSQK